MLEARWALMRRTTSFIEDNKEKWRKRDQETKNEKLMTPGEWDLMERNEKEEIMKEIERENLKEKGKRLARSWKVWRGKDSPHPHPNNSNVNPVPLMPNMLQDIIPENPLESTTRKERTTLKPATIILQTKCQENTPAPPSPTKVNPFITRTPTGRENLETPETGNFITREDEMMSPPENEAVETLKGDLSRGPPLEKSILSRGPLWRKKY